MSERYIRPDLMRPGCKDLVESWQRINDAAAKMAPASTDAAIREHIKLFDAKERPEAERRARDIVRLNAFAPDELMARANVAAKTLSMNIDSVGLSHVDGVAC